MTSSCTLDLPVYTSAMELVVMVQITIKAAKLFWQSFMSNYVDSSICIYLDGRSLVLGRKTGGRVTSLYADLFHRPKIGGTNQIAVTKAMHS